MRASILRFPLLAAVLSVSVLVAATAPVYAAAPTANVSLVACFFANGGSASVPAGTDFNITAGYGTSTLWQEAMFFLSVKVVADIGGVPIDRTYRYWTRPQAVPPDFWIMTWKYPVRALGQGQSITVNYAWILRFPIYNGTGWTPRGPLLTVSCTITGA
jgi:hypothetical protein